MSVGRARAASVRKVPLKDLVVTYGEESRPRRIGALYNPFGLALWLNIEQMAVVLVCKRYLIFGTLVVRALPLGGLLDPERRPDLMTSPAWPPPSTRVMRALRLRGLLDPKGRADLIGSPAGPRPTTRDFLIYCLRMLVLGVPLDYVGASVKLTSKSTREFRLSRRVTRSR